MTKVSLALTLALVLAVCAGARGDTPCSTPVDTCRHRFALPGTDLQQPYYATYALDRAAPEVSRAIIVVHGILRDADDYFSSIVKVAEARQALDSTLILSPKFEETEDRPLPDEPFWPGGGWKWGEASEPAGHAQQRISSYAIVDAMVRALQDPARFKNLRSIVVVGHSGGGQFVDRYAIGAPVLTGNALEPRYVVANPSSYLYLDNRRPVLGSLDRFAVPDASDCPEYDDFGYGLLHLNAYLAATPLAEIVPRFLGREVTYLIGGNDTLTEDLDMGCEAMLEGKNRRERGEAFYHYVTSVWHATRHHFVLVPGVGHDHTLMFNSPEGSGAIFTR